MLQKKAQKKVALERRQYDRFRSGDNACVVIPTHPDRFYGFLVDISKGGVSFEYIPFDEPIKDANELDIIMDGTGVRFNRLPVKSISDFEIQDHEYSPVRMRRRSVQFTDLTPDQISTLEGFIQNNTPESAQAN